MDINRAYDAHLAIGFPVVLEGNAESLQLVTERDRTNWLTVLGICNDAMAAEMGDVPMGAPIICTSGAEYVLTFAQCGYMIREMRSWGIAADANWRRLLREAQTVTTRADLEAIDLTQGWP